MNAETFSKILLIQALEESDPHGKHLPLSTRHHATQQAREKQQLQSDHSSKAVASFLTTRSETLWAFVEKAFPGFAKSWKQYQFDIPAFLVAIPALIVGLLINGLGESQRVNLLNFPLLIMLLWNGWTYLSSALIPLFTSLGKTIPLDTVARWLAQLLEKQKPRSWPIGNISDPTATSWAHESTKRFTTLWWPHVRPIWTNRLRQLLHLGAVCVALGMIFGMYIRGLALDYQATWESTFLSVNQVHGILHILLGPAAWLLQYSFPNTSELANLQAPQHGPAGQWIHMWGVTIFAAIVIPRSIMVWIKQRSLNKAKETFVLPLDDPYYIHLLATDRGKGVHIDILPYSYHPSPNAKNFLDLVLLDLFGNLSSIQWHHPIPFGQEFSNSVEVSTHLRTSVVIFNAGQTPEGEVHGEWLHSMQTQLDSAKTGSRFLILLDEEPYSQAIDKNRVIQRRQAWRRLISQYHLSVVPFHANTTLPDSFLQPAQAGLWPASP